MAAIKQTGTDGKKTESGKIGVVWGIHHQIGGELFAHELIVWHSFVKSPDDPVPIGVGEWIKPTGTTCEIAFSIRIASQVQPVTSPSFAKTRRSKKLVHRPFIGIRSVILLELTNLLKRRRQSRQIK